MTPITNLALGEYRWWALGNTALGLYCTIWMKNFISIVITTLWSFTLAKQIKKRKPAKKAKVPHHKYCKEGETPEERLERLSRQGFQIGAEVQPHPITGRIGRPPGACLTANLKNALNECNETGQPFGEVLILIAVECALKGNFKYFKEIYDRVEGKPMENINLVLEGTHNIIRKAEKTPVKTKPKSRSKSKKK